MTNYGEIYYILENLSSRKKRKFMFQNRVILFPFGASANCFFSVLLAMEVVAFYLANIIDFGSDAVLLELKQNNSNELDDVELSPHSLFSKIPF